MDTDTHSDIDMTDTFSSYVHDETVQVCTAGKVADPTRWDVLAATAETIKYKQTNNSTHLAALYSRWPTRASTRKTFIHWYPAVLVIIQQLQLTLSISHGSQHLPWTVIKQVNLFLTSLQVFFGLPIGFTPFSYSMHFSPNHCHVILKHAHTILTSLLHHYNYIYY